MKKPSSAYLLFCNDRRKQVVEENPGKFKYYHVYNCPVMFYVNVAALLLNTGLRIGEIQKLISVQWKELSAEEKEHYTQLATKDRERYEKEKLENPVVVEDSTRNEEENKTVAEAYTCIYPLGRVKKIIQTDPDVGKVSRDALIAISKASELFAQFLATKSYEQTLYNNKRQIKSSDVTRTIQTTGALDWLREDFPDMKPAIQFATNSSKGGVKKTTENSSIPAASDFFKLNGGSILAPTAAANSQEE